MSPKLKEYLNKRKGHIENEEFDKLLERQTIEDDILEELLDFLYSCGAAISPQALGELLCDYYVQGAADLSADKKEEYKNKAIYLTNMHQLVIYKTLTAKDQRK